MLGGINHDTFDKNVLTFFQSIDSNKIYIYMCVCVCVCVCVICVCVCVVNNL